MYKLFGITLSLLIIVTAACGDSKPMATPTPAPTPTPELAAGVPFVDFEISNFQHKSVTIEKGTTVIWTNKDLGLHTTVEGVPKGEPVRWDSKRMAKGETFRHTFNEVGEYPYVCGIHITMMATITVVEPS